jgi:biotin carboxyl carrier protein
VTPHRVLERTENSARIEIEGEIHQLYFAREGSAVVVWHNGTTYRVEGAKQGGGPQHPVNSTGEIRAPMPGKVLHLNVAVDSVVAERDTVVILESMKMETSLHAGKSGRVCRVLVEPGQVVEMGELLIVIE